MHHKVIMQKNTDKKKIPDSVVMEAWERNEMTYRGLSKSVSRSLIKKQTIEELGLEDKHQIDNISAIASSRKERYMDEVVLLIKTGKLLAATAHPFMTNTRKDLSTRKLLLDLGVKEIKDFVKNIVKKRTRAEIWKDIVDALIRYSKYGDPCGEMLEGYSNDISIELGISNGENPSRVRFILQAKLPALTKMMETGELGIETSRSFLSHTSSDIKNRERIVNKEGLEGIRAFERKWKAENENSSSDSSTEENTEEFKYDLSKVEPVHIDLKKWERTRKRIEEDSAKLLGQCEISSSLYTRYACLDPECDHNWLEEVAQMTKSKVCPCCGNPRIEEDKS